MTTALITTPGTSTWPIPAGIVAGQYIQVENWGAGSGGSGTGATDGGGGAGGSYSQSQYLVQQADITSGIAYTVPAGGAGNTGVGSVGPDCLFGPTVNNIPNSIMYGASVGSNTLPTGWIEDTLAGLTRTVTDVGINPATGRPYIVIRWSGTASATGSVGVHYADNGKVLQTFIVTTVATYTYSLYLAVAAGAFVGTQLVQRTTNTVTSGYVFVGQPIAVNFTPTGTLTRYSTAAAMAATSAFADAYLSVQNITSGDVTDISLWIEAPQFELAGAATTWTSSRVLAKGGNAPVTTAGGVGGPIATSIGMTKFAGGSGRAFNSAGSPGGGSGGKDGAGVTPASTTSGAGDNSLGGAGVAVKSTSPGNPGTSNVEGGAGGGALITVAGVGGVGGTPGGGGGGSDFTSGTRTGGAGGPGQIRITYTPTVTSIFPIPLIFKAFSS